MMIVVTLGWELYLFLSSLFPLPDQPTEEVNAGPLIFAIILNLGYGFVLYLFWTPGIEEQKNMVLPIYGSAMVFAISHSTWPTPIPLFFLGIGLGYLAYRTQNLMPGIIAHGLFNAVTCLTLVLQQMSLG